MLSQSQIKYVKSLQQKKYRRQYRAYVAEGEKIVSELWSSHFVISGIYALPGWLEIHRHKIPSGVNIFELSSKELHRISGMKTPTQVLAVVKMPERVAEPLPCSKGITLVLDQVQDPGNLGTIIRTADWFGVRKVICSPNTAEIFSPKVIQATMGSFLRVEVIYTELVPFIEKFSRCMQVYGAFLEGKDLFDIQTRENCLLVIGNESKGISKAVADLIPQKIRIHGGTKQQGKAGSAESLNASVASGILIAWLSKNYF